MGLGFGMNLQQVLRAGKSGFVYTAVGIAFALILGTLIGKLLAVRRRPSFLISTGTAICGGSAIAAVGPVVGATEDEMSVSLGTIFLLNSVALLTFPAIGIRCTFRRRSSDCGRRWLSTTPVRWSAPAAKYGAVALAIGTTVKLARALWIVPVTVATAVAKGSKTRIQWPWFILFFCLAAVANTYLFPGSRFYHLLTESGKVDADLHAVSHRGDAIARGPEEGRAASAVAGRAALDHRGCGKPAGDPRGMDCDLGLVRIPLRRPTRADPIEMEPGSCASPLLDAPCGAGHPVFRR